MADTAVGYVRGANVSGAFLDALMDLLGEDGYRTIGGTIRVETGPCLVPARNQLVKVFLESTDLEWLWLTDTDMSFGADVISRLKRIARPDTIAGALCFGWFSGARVAKPTLYGEGMCQITDWVPGSIVPVYATGAACLLIHRQTLERMPYGKWFRQCPDGTYGEDQGFFMNAAEAGIKTYVDTSTPVLHCKEILVGPGDYVRADLEALFTDERNTYATTEDAE